MVARGQVCIRQLGDGDGAETKCLRRFLANTKVTVPRLIEGWSEQTGPAAAGRHVLAIQDTSEINFRTRPERRRGLGETGKGRGRGALLHGMLAVDADTGDCLGLVSGSVATRSGGRVEIPHAKRALADKESRRWIDMAAASAAALHAAGMVTSVCDREGDIYELFAAERPANAHLLVRAAQDRSLAGGDQMFGHANALAAGHRYEIEVPEKPGQTKRAAAVAVGFGPIEIRRPARAPRGSLPDSIAMNLVAVREIAPPEGAEPVRWVLLTTHAVDTVEAALEVVGWYRKRWHIEQLFRTLKTQGFNVEESQVVEGHALMNLVTAALIAAMQTLQLTLARDGTTRQPIGDAFTAAERRVLAAAERSLPGKTAKQLNPHPPDSLAWAAWIIARLGGWTGYASQRPPGPKTMHLGLTEFEALAQGWLLCEENV